jgi:glycosyltransferase involved in cell wall biosynthesis
MHRILFFLFILCAGFLGGAAFARKDFLLSYWKGSHTVEKETLENGFHPSPYPLQNHPFVILVVGRNHGATIEKTLTSLFSQKYENFRIHYVDDGSDDGSLELARALLYDMKYLIPTTLTHNEKSLGAPACLFAAVQECLDEEIIVIVEPHDWLSHEWVLEKLNQYYANPDLWLTYGQCRKYPTFELKDPMNPFPLPTFYASLFKKLQKKDCTSYMPSLLDMAKDHVQHLSDILYIANPEMRESL